MTATLPMHRPASIEGWPTQPSDSDAEVDLEPYGDLMSTPLNSRLFVAYLLLATFVIAATAAGFLLGYGIPAGWGCVGLAGSSLIAAFLLGQE